MSVLRMEFSTYRMSQPNAAFAILVQDYCALCMSSGSAAHLALHILGRLVAVEDRVQFLVLVGGAEGSENYGRWIVDELLRNSPVWIVFELHTLRISLLLLSLAIRDRRYDWVAKISSQETSEFVQECDGTQIVGCFWSIFT